MTVMTEATGRVRPQRPGLVRWLWYAYGGGLPERYREWVLYDLTTPSWGLRHFGRALLQVLPLAAVLMLVVPGALWIRIAAVCAGMALGVLYSCAYMVEIAEHRVAKAGYPVGTAGEVRDDAQREDRAGDAERYARTWREDPEAGE